MKLTLLSVPYDSGLRGYRMGAGPEHLIGSGLTARLKGLGHATETVTLKHRTDPPAEIRTGFELMQEVADAVSLATDTGRFSVVLSGNCNTSVGTIAGLGRDIGVVWFDAHGDFNTPETTTSGFLDGMGLAVLVGRCWSSLAGTVPGFRPRREEDVVLAGVRALDRAERELLDSSGVNVVSPEGLRDGHTLGSIVTPLAPRVQGVYLHLDPDVIDPSHGRANTYAAPGGISPDELLAAVREVCSQADVRAVGIASYDPAADATGSIRETILDVVAAVLSS